VHHCRLYRTVVHVQRLGTYVEPSGACVYNSNLRPHSPCSHSFHGAPPRSRSHHSYAYCKTRWVRRTRSRSPTRTLPHDAGSRHRLFRHSRLLLRHLLLRRHRHRRTFRRRSYTVERWLGGAAAAKFVSVCVVAMLLGLKVWEAPAREVWAGMEGKSQRMLAAAAAWPIASRVVGRRGRERRKGEAALCSPPSAYRRSSRGGAKQCGSSGVEEAVWQ
jgi:hypothetical protein